jgi:hypothetical protein
MAMYLTNQPKKQDDLELVYDLKRAGPKNYDKFMMKNLFEPKLGEFDYASSPVKDLYALPLEEITSLEVVGEQSEDRSPESER